MHIPSEVTMVQLHTKYQGNYKKIQEKKKAVYYIHTVLLCLGAVSALLTMDSFHHTDPSLYCLCCSVYLIYNIALVGTQVLYQVLLICEDCHAEQNFCNISHFLQ